MSIKRFIRFSITGLLLLVVTGYFIPQHFIMPVKSANSKCYESSSFWFYPWGKSVTHKGVDIFTKKGTDVLSSTTGLVVFCGQLNRGGNVIIVLGPKWRFHYYAHLNQINISSWKFIHSGKVIGTVGTTGNAIGKPPHLHYSIFSLFPLPWRADGSKHGWKKMFYLNPIDYLKDVQ